MAKRLLVTGASGFVGRALCAEFASAGNSVTGLGRSIGQEILPGVAYHRFDLETDELDESVIGDVDCVVHLAGQAHGKGGSERQQLDGFRRTNVEASLKLARSAIDAGVRRFVFVSSIGVHGTLTNGAAISENTPFKPSSPYTVSKMEAELELTKLFETARSTELTIVRPPLVYGERAPGNFGSLLKLAGSPIPLPFGMCSNRRSLISLEGLVDFLIVCTNHPAAGNQSFVVADSSVVSTGDIVASLRAGMGRSGRLVPIPSVLMAGALTLLAKREMYIQLFCDLEIENHKAKELLGWAPCDNTKGQLEMVGKRYADSSN